jgi:hypothetical protein
MAIPETFLDVIKIIGSPVLIGIVLSLMLKEWTWFAGQKPAVKWSVTLAVSVLLPVLSQVLITCLPASWMVVMEWIWVPARVGLAAWAVSQGWNVVINNRASRQTSVFDKTRA